MTATSPPLSDERNWPVVASYAVVLGMVICLAIVAIQFLQWIVPTWDASGMLVLCILAAMEAVASHSLIKRLPTAQRQLLFYRLTEWAIILVLLKLFAELVAGPASLWNNILLWPDKFPFNILNGHFWLTLAPVFLIWEVSNLFDNDLVLLGTVESFLLDERVKLTPVRDLIVRRFLNVGMLVVVLAGIPRQVAIPSTQPVPANSGIPAVVMYFVFGIILLSLTRYTSLVTTWRQARVNIPVQIPRRWFAYSAAVIGALALLVAWMPTNYGMGFLDTITAMIGLIYELVASVYAFVFMLINALFRMLFHTGKAAPPVLEQPLTPPQNNLQLNPVPSAINWTLIKSIFFWVLLIVLVVVALRQYILFNQDLAEELKRFRPFRWLMIFLKRVTTSVKKANKSIGIFVQSSINRLRNAGKSPINTNEWAYINPRRLEPRQKIIFYYLALLRRAGEAGLPRKDGQTPYEYADSLTTRLETGKDGVESLTESFIEARYSRHEIPAKEASRVESLWETIRQLLRTVRKSKQEEKKAGGN